MQGRIERALVDPHGIARHLLEPLGDPVPVGGLERQDLEDEHVERALRDREA